MLNMCLRPINLITPAKRLDKQGGQLVKFPVPCNKCAECLDAIRTSWRFRAYHEAKDTIAKGGYVYFDTLTYSDEHVPHISDFVDIQQYPIRDFMCFNYKHLRDFMKRLRRRLEYHYGASDFKYFATTEYGTSETGTHRPHIHILFYVNSGFHPFTFSKAVAESWHYGITDGLPHKSMAHVCDHIYGFDKDSTNESIILKLCNYVSKYVTKDSTFQTQIDNRIALLENYFDDKNELSKIKRCISMYHRQSQGFGLSFLSSMTLREIDSLLNDDVVQLPSTDRDVVKTAPIPAYYKRKLFYRLKQREDKTYYWELTDIGRLYQTKRLLKRVDKVVDNCKNVIMNSTPQELEYIDFYLNGRTLHDYAVYNVFYQGRLRPHETYDFANLCPVYDLTDDEYNLYDWLKKIDHASQVNSLCDFQCYLITDDKVNLNYFFQYDKKQLIDRLAINQGTCSAFANFDDLYTLFKDLKRPNQFNKQSLADYKEYLTKLFKSHEN